MPDEYDVYDIDNEGQGETYGDRYPEEFDEDVPDIDDQQELETEDHEEETVYRTQEDFDRAIKNRLKRYERKVAGELGVSLQEAKDWIEAGRSVSQASGLTPAQIKMKLEETRMQNAQQAGQSYQPNVYPQDDVKKELAEMKSLIEEDRVEKVRTRQEQEARKEFGDLFSKHQDDIEEKAEEFGLSLVDAAAIVLRPKLKEYTETRVRNKQQLSKSRKIEDSNDSPDTKEVDLRTALTDKEKRTAQRMGVSLEKYYNQKKALGEIE